MTLKRGTNMDWKTKKMLGLASIHKYFGYFMLFATQIAVITGIIRRIDIANNDQPKKVGLILGNVVLFVGTLVIGEINHQRRLRTEVKLKSVDEVYDSMSREDFANAIREGRQLVILDNLVLNVGEFINSHPGGRFVIRHNIGQDISKFFFGGYCLEDNIPRAAAGHNHSSYARLIVNQLVEAIYE